jgi:hypothetical protein
MPIPTGVFWANATDHKAIVWILGGDKFVGDDEERRILEAMAHGFARRGPGPPPDHLPSDRAVQLSHLFPRCTLAGFQHDPDRSHPRPRQLHLILAEYSRTPIKPVLDGEPGYENIPHAFDGANPRLEAIHTRRFCYWALFSGAFGHTYGCNDIWQMWKRGDNAIIAAKLPWDEAIHLPGAGQMQYARALIESGPYFDRMPDPSLVEPPNTTGPDYVAACRAPDARYALVYFPSGKTASLRTFLLKGQQV